MTDARILVVEDERIVGKDIERRLKDLGYRVAGVVSTGEKTIEKVKESVPDLILMDIRLKGAMDGIETAEVIRNEFDIPVVYLTAYADEATLDRAKVTEPFGYILKPFNERDLHSTIEMALYKHKMEKRLTEKEAWLSTTLRSIGDGVITTDVAGVVNFLNPAAETLTGLDQEDALGRKFNDLCAVLEEGLQNLPENYIKRTIEEGVGTASFIHSTLMVRNGRKIPVDNSVAPIRSAKGDVTGAVLVFRDVTERKIAEEELRESEERFRLTFDQSPIGAAIVSLDFRFLRVNAELSRITAYAEKEFAGLKFPDIVHPDDLEAGLEKMEALVSGSKSQFGMDARCVRKGGSSVWIHLSAGLMKDINERPLYFLLNVEDIDERKRLESQLKVSQEMRVLGQLAAGVAHEVRNPLNAILAITEALFLEIGNNEEYGPYLEHIRTQVNRLSSLMKDLLELGKPIQRSLLRRESLMGILTSTLSLWRQTKSSGSHPSALHSGIEGNDVFVTVDGSRLQQVFLNLLENAAQHSHEGSEIKLTIFAPQDDMVKVLVTDPGAGIPPDKLDKVFEPFFTTRRGGVGLGLSLVKHFVGSMGGSVWIRNNEPPPGCTVEVALPVSGEVAES
jgi:PAS domain S-box-containing protein